MEKTHYILTAIIFGFMGCVCLFVLPGIGLRDQDDRQMFAVVSCLGMVATVISAAAIYSALRKSEAPACPQCSSLNSKEVVTHYKGTPFFGSDRECLACRTIWRPACPKLAATVAIFGGGIMTAFFGGIMIQGIITFMKGTAATTGYLIWPWPAIVGILFLVYGIRVFRGKAGQIHILKTRDSNDAREQTRRP
jgi:hypothetical protein